MTLFALGAKCGFLGASGLTNFVTPSAAAACEAKKRSSSRPARATPVKPAPASQKNSRRVRPQKLRGVCAIVVSPSILLPRGKPVLSPGGAAVNSQGCQPLAG